MSAPRMDGTLLAYVLGRAHAEREQDYDTAKLLSSQLRFLSGRSAVTPE